MKAGTYKVALLTFLLIWTCSVPVEKIMKSLTAGEFQFAVDQHLELTSRLAIFTEAEYDTEEKWEFWRGSSYLLSAGGPVVASTMRSLCRTFSRRILAAQLINRRRLK